MAFFYQDFDTVTRLWLNVHQKRGVGRCVYLFPWVYPLISWFMLFIFLCFFLISFPAHAIDKYIEAEELSADASPDAGVEAYRFAAQQGDLLAQLNLGAMFYYGLGTAKNYSKAIFWYRKAAQQGEPLAQFKLGVMLADGLGVTKDSKEAVHWFRQVAVKSNPLDSFATDIIGWSRLRLGFMYQKGEGVVKDLAESALWFGMAAERGYAVAQLQLGQLALQSGDLVLALKWFKMAAAQGQVEAIAAVVKLEKELTPAQIAKATAEAALPVKVMRPPLSLPVEESVSAPAPEVVEKRSSSDGKLIYGLTVESDPPNAQVEILNITPPYYPGMALEPGRYHLKVSQEGFSAQKRWVTINDAPVKLPVKLERVARVTPVEEVVKVAPPESAKPLIRKREPTTPPPSPPEQVLPLVVEQKPVPEKSALMSSLLVKPEPVDATVRIINIRPAYRPGMALKAGRYLIEVSRSGYKTARHWMQLPGGGTFEVTAPLEPE